MEAFKNEVRRLGQIDDQVALIQFKIKFDRDLWNDLISEKKDKNFKAYFN